MTKQIKQLNREQRRKLIINKLKISPELSDRAIAKMLGVSPTTVGTIRRELSDKDDQFGHLNINKYDWTQHPYLKAHPEILEGLSDASLRALKAPGVLDKMQERQSKSPRYCQIILRKEKSEANKHSDIIINRNDIKIFQGDLKTGLHEIKDESINLVFIDPPYNLKSVQDLYRYIPIVSERILVDGGSLMVMCGGTHLDVAIKELTSANTNLKFNWNISYICQRGTPLIHNRRVMTAVKNIIWLVKGKYTGNVVFDLIQAPYDPNKEDKEPHVWGQSVEAVKDIIEKFTVSGDTVCDFMVGGGSTAVAAALSNRRFVGCDIDPVAVKTTKQRIDALFGL